MPVSFAGAVVLAPMVRVSTLPMRLLALEYGADLVYVEEVVDRRLLASRRVENARLGTVDFVQLDGTVVFRTCATETDRLVFQLGTADPQRAVAAAKMIEKDVACVDVNMGCPKDYSTKGGMGAALLSDPDRAEAILRALVANLSVPVTCKIRVLDSESGTVQLAQRLASTGIACLTVHGRTRCERPRHANRNETIAAVSRAVGVPVLANGASGDLVKLPSDVEYFRRLTAASGVMLARAAMRNPSIFCRRLGDRLVDAATLVKQYLAYAITYENPFPQSKYCVQQLLHERTESKEYRLTLAAQTWHEMCQLWDLADWYASLPAPSDDRSDASGRQSPCKRKLPAAAGDAESTAVTQEPLCKRRLAVADNGEIVASFRFFRRQYRPKTSPKMILHSHCIQHRLGQPVYSTRMENRLYYSQVRVEGAVYRNLLGDLSKKYAEQSAACVCLVHLGLDDGRKDEGNS